MKHGAIAASPGRGEQGTSHQLAQIRERLDSAMRMVDQVAGVTSKPAVNNGPITEASIRAMIRLRRNRDLFFKSGIFADPAWDILLELYASELGQFRLSITTLCVGAAVPSTTALRWIGQLENMGLIVKRSDPTDGRRIFVSLSHSGLQAMENYFRTVPAGAALI